MSKLTYYIAHCLDTPPNLTINREHLKTWHMGPHDTPEGKVIYLGKTYPSRNELPDHEINGRSIKTMHGNGWSRLGYSVLFHRNGSLEIITPYNDDDTIDTDELTFGCAGINAFSRHFALEGGMNANRYDDFFDHFTREQFTGVRAWLKSELKRHPYAKVGGHNDFANRECPGFRVYDLMDLYGMTKYAYKQ